MTEANRQQLIDWAAKYNDPVYFVEDPIAFPREFVKRKASLKDIEIAAVFAAHFAWGRRSMIVRDLERFFDCLEWKPLDYVMSGDWRSDERSIHRTIKWSETAAICRRLKEYYERNESLETLCTTGFRTAIYGQKADAKAPNKKINMLRRWMIRRDGKVDLGLWTASDPAALVIPLDVHVYDEALALGLTNRRAKDIGTAIEITEAFKEIFPGDPVLGDFALFGYGVNKD